MHNIIYRYIINIILPCIKQRVLQFSKPFVCIYLCYIAHNHTHAPLEVSIPHGECFLAIGFELQPVELCSPHCVKSCGSCAQHTHPTRAQLPFVPHINEFRPSPSPCPFCGFTPCQNWSASIPCRHVWDCRRNSVLADAAVPAACTPGPGEKTLSNETLPHLSHMVLNFMQT